MVGSLCHRFGPGRLPYAARRDVGGGVAMGATALLATVLWFVLLALGRLAAPDSSTLALILGLGLFSPLAVVGGFLAGTLLWRHFVPDRPDPLRGAIAGGLTVILALVPVAVGIGGLIAVSNLGSLTPAQAVEAVVDLVMVSLVSFVFAAPLTGWLGLPLGIFGGWYHERAQYGADGNDVSDRSAA